MEPSEAAIRRAILCQQLAVWALAAALVALLHHPRVLALCAAAGWMWVHAQKKTLPRMPRTPRMPLQPQHM